MGKERELARTILQHVGGPENITSVMHCMTRLRLSIINDDSVSLDSLRNVDGVLGVIEDDTLQIVLGPGVVAVVTNEVKDLMKESKSSSASASKEKNLKQAQDTNSAIKRFLKKLAAIFIPLIPAIVGSGLIAGITNALVNAGVSKTLPIMQMLEMIGMGLFGYLAIFVGINTAKEFDGTPALGGAAGILIMNPALASITLFGEKLLPGRGGLIGVIFAACFIAFCEKRIRRFVPASLDIIITPTLSLLVTGFVTLFILQPVGGLLSDFITKGLLHMLDVGGIAAGLVLGGTFLPLVVTGLHQGLTPIHMELLNAIKSDPLLPILAMGGAGQVGAAFAIYFKTKNKRLKKLIKGALPVGLLGIGEPLIFGVTLPLGRPFFTACLGAAIGGAFQAVFKVATVSIGVSGLPLAFLIHGTAGQIVYYLCGLLLAYVSGFILTWLFGFKENQAKAFTQPAESNKKGISML
ncbi:hypothetical protein A374_09983 [Fictibacillus macauensis ZFHKF-1]|uniref:PTS sugar transporter subunit IIC n=1 Tax=Fictibacillus macauensis ZFHKF-1 TaxID=1196324 RepID=I8UFH5_9BACL|nr:PTS transporter subunit EIIC [Fictibacillus macauensis]EIT85558.1 hypothetical protein A374_09983 [Fictibacillus macauensis ZFHKF-1]